MFGTLYQAEAIVRDEQNNKILSESGKEVSKTQSLQANKKITFQDLIEAGYLKDGQVLYLRFHNQLVDDEQAQVVRPNSLKYHGQPYKQSPLAKILIQEKHHLVNWPTFDGPLYWFTEKGESVKELQNKLKQRNFQSL